MSGATIVGPISYAVATKGLEYPLGTGPDFVVQDFDPQSFAPAPGVYSTDVTGFNPRLDCDILNIDRSSVKRYHAPWISIMGNVFIANITTPSCKINNAIIAQTADHDFMYRENATQNYQGNIQNYTCNDPDFQIAPDWLRSNHTASNQYAEQRILITMADVRWPPTNNTIYKNTPYLESYRIEAVTAMLCRPSYLLNTYTARKYIDPDTSKASTEVSMSRKNTSRLLNVSTNEFLGGLMNTFLHMSMGNGGEDYVLSHPVPNFFQVLSAANNESGLAPFMDAELLKNISVNVWQTTAVQYARQYFMVPANDSVTGSISYSQNRLQVKLVPAILLSTILGMLFFIALGVWWFRPQPAVPHDPAPLAAMATLLASSPGFSKLMDCLGAARMSYIRDATADKYFQTTVSNRAFTLEVKELRHGLAQTSEKEKPFKWWRPFVTKSWFLLLTATVSITIAVFLIVLQHISNTQQGIIDISLNAEVVPRYLAATVMLSLSTVFSSIEGASAIMSPFSRLKTGNALAQSTIEFNIVGKLLPHAILVSARKTHFHHVLSGIALFVAGFLTTITSGLYTVTSVSVSETVTLSQVDSFDFSQSSLFIDDRNAAAITSILEYTNLSYPAWTYGDLVFNKLDTPVGIRGDGTINLNTPAYRARLDCTPYIIPTKEIKVDEWSPSYDWSSYSLDTNISVRCVHIPTNQTTVLWRQQYQFQFNRSSFYSGKATFFLWEASPKVDVYGNGGFESQSDAGFSGMRDHSAGDFGCPTFGFTVASSAVTPGRSSNNSTLHTRATAVMCTQHLEQVTVNVTLIRAADLSIDSTKYPPVPDETTRKRLRNPATSGSEVWEWLPNNLLNRMVDLSPTPQLQHSDSRDRDYVNRYHQQLIIGLDGFVKTLVDGKAGVPIDSLLGEENQGALVEAGSRLYSEYMAQAISNNMRNASSSSTNTVGDKEYDDNIDGTTSSTSPPTFQGTFTHAPGSRWRLRQNRGPAIALEVLLFLLAAIALLLAFVGWNRADVLPHNPCSIAGTASLLAGSEVCSRKYVPEGAEWWSDKERRDAGLWEGCRLRMGWYGDDGDFSADQDGEGRRFGVYVKGEGEHGMT
ncbi:hypothetical protein BFW01_g8085 [Lasiodiplodia theobromae]|nr:hypothetical protein BFW01_g8085 [Lasiodiplodia theobromae]